MRMEIVTAILCIHMLLWAGCNAAPGAYTLGSDDETLFRKAQPGKIFWRKLLEENTWKPPDVITDASIKTEPKSVDPNNARVQNAEGADLKENVVLDAKIETAIPDSSSWTAQQEEGKSESMALPTRTENDTTKEEDINSQKASNDPKERGNYTPEMEKIEKTEDPTTQAIAQSQAEENPTPSTKEDDAKVSEQGAKTWESAQQASSQSVVEENSWQITQQKQDHVTAVEEEARGNQEGSGVDTENKWQGDVKEELVEEGKKDSMPEQKGALVEDSAPDWKDARVAEDKKDGGALEQKDVIVEEDKKDSVPEQKDAKVEEDKNDSVPEQKDTTVGEDKKDSASEQKDAKVEEDKKESAPEQKDAMPGDEKALGNDRQETLTEETGTVIQRTETKEEHTEDNPIRMVETGSGEKQTYSKDDAKIEMVHSNESEDGDKGHTGLESPPASTEEQASSDSSNGERSTPSDTKVEDQKIEENNQARDDNVAIVEKKGEENNTWKASQEKIDERGEEKREEKNTWEVSQEKSDERGEEKREESNKGEVLQEKSDERGEEKREENNTGEMSQEKSDAEKRELSDENTEPKHEESEKQKAEEALRWKSEEKAEEGHEEITAENHEEIAVQNREVPTEDNTEVKDKEGERSDGEEVSQRKADDETQAAAKEVESQLEALKRDTVFDTTNDQRQESSVDPSDDEYDIIHELADLPTNIQETAGKVAEHIRPDLLRWTDTSKVYFNFANQQISESFSPLIGKEYAPFFASMISYGILLLPLLVVILLFDHIKALFSLQKVLLFINIYLAAYFATLWLASFIIGLEPMSFFYHNSLSSYLSLQILQALGYVVYLILQTANMINSCSSETRVGKLTSGLQWVVAMGIGLHYYVTVFHPAVASKPPHTSWKFYAIYSAAFFVLCLFARIRWVKKRYVSAGNDMANKKS